MKRHRLNRLLTGLVASALLAAAPVMAKVESFNGNGTELVPLNTAAVPIASSMDTGLVEKNVVENTDLLALMTPLNDYVAALRLGGGEVPTCSTCHVLNVPVRSQAAVLLGATNPVTYNGAVPIVWGNVVRNPKKVLLFDPQLAGEMDDYATILVNGYHSVGVPSLTTVLVLDPKAWNQGPASALDLVAYHDTGGVLDEHHRLNVAATFHNPRTAGLVLVDYNVNLRSATTTTNLVNERPNYTGAIAAVLDDPGGNKREARPPDAATYLH